MIRTQQVLRKGSDILLGIGLDNAVLDILTNEAQLQACLQMLEEPAVGLTSVSMGTFGIYPVTLNLHPDETVSIFIDGPDFEKCRSQSAAIWPGKEALRGMLIEAMQGASSVE